MSNTLHLYLREWPKHPVLTNLILIIKRILSFSITSPLMKFITGLELLLSKAQVLILVLFGNFYFFLLKINKRLLFFFFFCTSNLNKHILVGM